MRLLTLIQFELSRLFLTKRALMALSAFTVVWFILLYYLVGSAVTLVSSAGFKETVEQVFGIGGISELLTWSVPELAIYWLIAIILFPVFAITAASDQTCSDRARGTLRFILLRASRAEILFGRFLAQALMFLVLIALTIIATLVMASFRENVLIGQELSRALIIYIELSISVLPFIGLMALINNMVDSAKSSVVACCLYLTLGPLLLSVIEYILGMSLPLSFIFPGAQLSELINQENIIINRYILPLAQTAIYMLGAHYLMKKAAL